MIDKRWIKDEYHGYNAYWYIVSKFVHRTGFGSYLILDTIKMNIIFSWVYQDICINFSSRYSFVDEKDVPEQYVESVREFISDPFFEIEAERFKISLTV